jgi:hypothetical protein
MAPDPADRLPSAAALREALAAVDLADPGGAAPAPVPAPVPVPAVAPPSVLPTTVPSSAASPRRKKARLRVPVAAVAVVVVGTGGTVAYQYLPPSTTEAPTTGSSDSASASPSASGTGEPSGSAQAANAGFGVPTTTEDCPAAEVAGLGGRCTTTAECWGGMVVTVGIVSVNRSDCLVSHPWETFAIAPLPSTGMTNNQRELENHPDVLKLCSREVLAESRRGDAVEIDPDRWIIDVLPPTQTQYADGLRVMRCVATISGEESTGAHFRPRV